MAYEQHESVVLDADQKVMGPLSLINLVCFLAGFLGMQQLCGALGIGGPTWSSGWLLSGALEIIGGVLLALLTIRVNGLAATHRVRLYTQYQMRRSFGHDRLIPSAPTRTLGRYVRPPILRDGEVIVDIPQEDYRG